MTVKLAYFPAAMEDGRLDEARVSISAKEVIVRPDGGQHEHGEDMSILVEDFRTLIERGQELLAKLDAVAGDVKALETEALEAERRAAAARQRLAGVAGVVAG